MLKTLIDNYHPSSEAINLISNNQTLLIAGISAAGKDTVKKALLKTNNFGNLISHTTRQPRQNDGVWEREGEDYFFINNQQAEKMLKNHEFIEAKYVHGTIYGTSLMAYQAVIDQNKTPTTDLDVQGIFEYQKINNNCINIFLLPPNYEIWLKRFRNRYSSEEEFQAEFAQRSQTAIFELETVLKNDIFQLVVNDELEDAVTTIIKIINHQQRSKDLTKIAKNLLNHLQHKKYNAFFTTFKVGLFLFFLKKHQNHNFFKMFVLK